MKNEAKIPHAQSGYPHIADECRRCGRMKATGTQYIRETDQRIIFVCDNCGMVMSMGWLEKSHLEMVQKKAEYEKIVANRERWRNEFTEKYRLDYEKCAENLKALPDVMTNFDEMLKGPYHAQ